MVGEVKYSMSCMSRSIAVNELFLVSDGVLVRITKRGKISGKI